MQPEKNLKQTSIHQQLTEVVNYELMEQLSETTLTSDDLESHIVVNVSSTVTNTTIWFVAALCFIVDVQTYGRTDVWTDGHFYRVY